MNAVNIITGAAFGLLTAVAIWNAADYLTHRKDHR